MQEKLLELANKIGIASSFSDAGMVRREYGVSPEILQKLLAALGYPAGTPREAEASLQKWDERRWRSVLEPVYVREQSNLCFDVVVPLETDASQISVRVFDEHNILYPVSFRIEEHQAEKAIDGRELKKNLIRLDGSLEIGYYTVAVSVGENEYKTMLAVAPERCYEAPGMEHKLWGYAIQLYSVKSERNWGVGDFTDLAELVKISAHSGADIIGLNPLNVLCHDFPENASPYQSISRLFLNPVYIDVERVPEYLSSDKLLIADLLDEIRNTELIAYGKIYPLKIKILEKCFERFQKSKDELRRDAFKKFCREQGDDLERLALFQSLYEVESPKVWGGWRAWPQEYRSPQAAGIKDFAAAHKDRIEFFKFLQFEADRQFSNAQKVVKDLGMKIGFYRDLAVGVGKDSAEYWSSPDLFIRDFGTGAPPDAFFPQGQKWGLCTFSPEALKEKRYQPFIKILRANMRNAGALRMDHVMSLMRLYVVEDEGSEGTYLYYNFEDMLNIVALESHLNQCVVVGESIGNIPDGFLDALHRRNIHPLSILWGERGDAGWGDFYAPEVYPREAFTSVGTHDIPPLKMWWFGYDIALNASLGIISEETKNEEYRKREGDRWKLLALLDRNGVWPGDRPRSGDYIYGENYPEGIEEAVHAFLARSNSQVFLAQLEDFLHVAQRQNLPGTDCDKHPNWRRRLPVALEKLVSDIAYIRNVAAIRRER